MVKAVIGSAVRKARILLFERFLMLRLKYFASVREAVGVAGEDVSFVENETVEQLIHRLSNKYLEAKAQLLDGALRAAVNQKLVEKNKRLCDGDEVAFFPPVTGG